MEESHSSVRPIIIGVSVFLFGAICAYGIFWYGARFSFTAPAIVHSNPETGARTLLAYGEQSLLRQPDFFKQVQDGFIKKKTTFLEANLPEMQVRFYRNGALEKEVAILTKGKEGSWWETPAGLYEIQSKSENHFSSFGRVYLPWSMAFQGNFFIHGWPYYPDGTPVVSTFSGGCIRLADEDAKALYKLAPVRTPVLVYEEDYGSDGFSYAITAPQVTATQYAVFDIKNGAVLSQSGMEVVRPIASLTKLATALIAAEYINLDKDMVINESVIVSTSVPRLVPGQSVSAYSLLLPLLLESSNEAAEAFAQHIGRARFVALMNEKVAALGMKDTHFTDPSGSEHTNVSSVSDLLRLAQYLYNNRSFVLNISSGREVPTLYRTTAFANLQNFNKIPGVNGFIGGKVGKNSIGESALRLFTISVNGVDRVVAVVVLDSENDEADTQALLEHFERTYSNTAQPSR